MARPKKAKQQISVHVSEELADLLDGVERVWRYSSKSDFFEAAAWALLGVETTGRMGKDMQKRFAKALLQHIRAVDEI